MTKIDDFKEYARKRIVERMRDGKKDTKKEEKAKIRSYEGEDSFYSGSDEEYKEFLDGLDVDVNSEAEPVNEVSGETINMREVIDRVKEKTGSIVGAAAAKMAEKTEEAVSKMKSREADNGETCFEKASEELASDISDMKTAIEDTMSDSMERMNGIDERLVNVADGFDDLIKRITGIGEIVAAMDKRIQAVEIQASDSVGTISTESADIKHEIGELKVTAEQIRDTVNGVSKLNDSVFDMKNAQQNTKTALTELQTAFNRLKKKTITGIVIISIVGLITIALEVVNLLA